MKLRIFLHSLTSILFLKHSTCNHPFISGWYPQGPLLASRELQRPPYGLAAGATIKDVKPTKQPIEAILGPARKPSTVSIEADMPLEYLPFAVRGARGCGDTCVLFTLLYFFSL